MRSKTPSGKRVAKPFNAEEYRFLDQLGLKGPQLMLGIRVTGGEVRGDEPLREYPLKPGRKWVKLAHKVGGKTAYYRALFLTPKGNEPDLVNPLADRLRADRDLDVKSPLLSTLCRYEKILNIAGLTCQRSYSGYARGHYPIDADFIQRMVTDQLPASLDDLIIWDSGLQRAAGSEDRWSLMLLDS